MQGTEQELLNIYADLLSREYQKPVRITYTFDPSGAAEEKEGIFEIQYLQDGAASRLILSEFNNQILVLKKFQEKPQNHAILRSDLNYANYVFSKEYQEKKNRGELSSFMRKGLLALIGVAVVSLVTVGAFVAAPFVALPLGVLIAVKFLIIPSLVYLSVIAYGIINDLLAVRQNLVYFFAGHRPLQKSLIKSNRKNAVAVAWGIFATGALGLGFGVGIGALTAITYGLSAAAIALGGLAGASVASMGMLPVLVSMAVLCYALSHLVKTIFLAHKHALSRQDRRESDYLSTWNWKLNSYSQVQYRKEIGLDPVKAGKACSNSDRNEMGYSLVEDFGIKVLKIQALSLLGTLVVGSIPAVHTFFSGLLLAKVAATVASVLTVFTPVGLAAAIGFFVLGSLTYLAVNHFRKAANKVECNLDFSGKELQSSRVVLSSSGSLDYFPSNADRPDTGKVAQGTALACAANS